MIRNECSNVYIYDITNNSYIRDYFFHHEINRIPNCSNRARKKHEKADVAVESVENKYTENRNGRVRGEYQLSNTRQRASEHTRERALRVAVACMVDVMRVHGDRVQPSVIGAYCACFSTNNRVDNRVHLTHDVLRFAYNTRNKLGVSWNKKEKQFILLMSLYPKLPYIGNISLECKRNIIGALREKYLEIRKYLFLVTLWWTLTNIFT